MFRVAFEVIGRYFECKYFNPYILISQPYSDGFFNETHTAISVLLMLEK